MENNPEYIDTTILLGYEVEIDVWVIEGTFYLGHDEPQYGVTLDWLNKQKDKLWIHCKNIEAIEWFNTLYNTYRFMKLVSWDVGIYNLSYCILEKNDEGNIQILDWDIVNLVDNEEMNQ
jgi:hypothetical protein